VWAAEPTKVIGRVETAKSAPGAQIVLAPVAAPIAVPVAAASVAPTAAPAPAAEPSLSTSTSTSTAIAPELGTRWAALVQALCDQGSVQALARELAVQSGLVDVDDGTQPPTWRLLVEREMLRNPALQDKLRAALSAALGHDIALDVAAGNPGDTPARRDVAERQRRQAVADAAIHADPVVQQLLAQYKTARIVPGSIKPLDTSATDRPTPNQEGTAP